MKQSQTLLDNFWRRCVLDYLVPMKRPVLFTLSARLKLLSKCNRFLSCAMGKALGDERDVGVVRECDLSLTVCSV